MKKIILIICFGLVLLFTTVAFTVIDDVVLTRIGSTNAKMKDAAAGLLGSSEFYFESFCTNFVIKACKAIPVAERVGIVNGVGRLVKTFVMSDECSKLYEKLVRESYASYTKPNMTDASWKEKQNEANELNLQLYTELAKESNFQAESRNNITQEIKTLDKTIEDFENGNSQMIEVYKQVGTTLESAKADKKEYEAILQVLATNKAEAVKRMAKFRAQLNIRMDFANELTTHNDRMKQMEEKLNLNKKEKVKAFLETFLAVSENIDFDAKLKKGTGYYSNSWLFENPEYQSKSSTWKQLYRAGKEPVMAARVFAQQWLNELN